VGLAEKGKKRMSQQTIIVEFSIKPGHLDEFEALIREHARRSLAEEPGCIRFDVIKPRLAYGTIIPDTIWLYELYQDMDAVKAHESSDRMPVLGQKTGPLVATKRLIYGVL